MSFFFFSKTSSLLFFFFSLPKQFTTAKMMEVTAAVVLGAVKEGILKILYWKGGDVSNKGVQK